jgi:hypothetical protein
MRKIPSAIPFILAILLVLTGLASPLSVVFADTLSELQALSAKRIWFAHQSVGNMIMHGPANDDAVGLNRIFLNNPLGGVRNVQEPGSIADIPPGTWADSFNGTNEDPKGKLDAFNAAVRTTFNGRLDYAILKFCWVDIYNSGITTNAQVDDLWNYYQSVMDPLEAAYPGRIIYATVPVTAAIASGGDAGNPLRERLSNYIRNKYGTTGRVFDIADWESRDANGKLVLGADNARMLNSAWNGDGGHPNAAGANMLAVHLLDLLAAVASPGVAAPAAPGGLTVQ